MELIVVCDFSPLCEGCGVLMVGGDQEATFNVIGNREDNSPRT